MCFRALKQIELQMSSQTVPRVCSLFNIHSTKRHLANFGFFISFFCSVELFLCDLITKFCILKPASNEVLLQFIIKHC